MRRSHSAAKASVSSRPPPTAPSVSSQAASTRASSPAAPVVIRPRRRPYGGVRRVAPVTVPSGSRHQP
ncbi:hypothetical protein ACFQ2M_25965 [Kitasatospora saccharophila]|uniref:hypothetical protein n=1 Tax=Kitasatospora saccharophila TaxID=407973 RepID=UPI003643F205